MVAAQAIIFFFAYRPKIKSKDERQKSKEKFGCAIKKITVDNISVDRCPLSVDI